VGDAETFVAHRDLMFALAYRILGTVADAEDAVQDAWLRWSAAPRDDVTEPRAYLARTVTNIALNRLRAARARREAYVGPWLPEPLLTRTDTDITERAEVAGALVLAGGRVIAAGTLAVAGGRVTAIHLVTNPEKLDAISGGRTLPL
jgi:RNA polymerase sigma-70 factor (ECF subfamily)